MKTNHIDIPLWLEDIANTVHSLNEAGNYYSQNIAKWNELWKAKSFSGGRLEEEISHLPDDDFIHAVVEVYSAGLGFARQMGSLLPSIISPMYEHNLVDFINKINGQIEKLNKHHGILDKCNEMINSKRFYRIDYDTIRALIELHDTQLFNFEHLTPDVLNIKKLAHNQQPLKFLD